MPATLTPAVDLERDHLRGDPSARVTLVEYGDFQCPYCREAYPVVRELLERFGGDLRFVFRHMPLTDLHPAAQRAAEASEAAAAQGRFWDMHDRLFASSSGVGRRELLAHAEALGLDLHAFERELEDGSHRKRVLEDLESGVRSGVPSTPRFYIDEVVHMGSGSFAELEWAVGSLLRER
jgi:NhaA family Na+:H+ antiporter